MPDPDDTVAWKMARMAGRAHGVVARRELLASGVSRQAIETRMRSGALIREFPGVYRVGHRAPSVEATYLAAVKACGEGAVLGGRAAAFLYGLLRRVKAPPAPEVTAPRARRVDGIVVRRARHIDTREVTTFRRIPITTPARTLVDLAAVLSPDPLAVACHEAGVRYGTTPAQVDAVLARRPRTRGAGGLRRILRGEAHVALSPLERRFIALLRDAHLPLPVTNRPAGSKRVDCRWPDHRLTIELDGYRYHNSRHAWEQDRRREREAHARGDDFRRYTWDDVDKAPTVVLGELRSLLGP
jgi:very-short-patch-repair endonuclease